MVSGMHAGAAEADVTPLPGIEMVEPRDVPSTGVHDRLFVRALALSDGTEDACVVTMDLPGLDRDLVQRMREAVLVHAGIASERLMLTASHTHNAPLTIGWCLRAQSRRDRTWEKQLVETVATTVARAREGLAPAVLTAGRARVQIGANRRLSTPEGTVMRPNPAGPVAPWVDVLRVDGLDGGPLALLFSHAAHPVTVHSASTEITADYPGYAGQAVRRRLGPAVMPMFAQACGGDINVEPLRGGFAEARRVGDLLGNAAADATASETTLAAGRLRVATRDLLLPFEPVDPAAVLQLERETYAALAAGAADEAAVRRQRDMVLWGERLVELTAGGASLDGLPCQVQGFAIGRDLALLGLSHEVFVDYQLRLQAWSPFAHTMVLAYTNGCAHYVPSGDAFPLGGYEVDDAHKHYGWPRLLPECEGVLRAAAMGVLDDLWVADPKERGQ